ELWSALTGTPTDDVFVIGGAKVYQEFLPYCDTCYITKIYADLNADRFFTNLDEDDQFTCEALSDVQEENGIRYQFYQYTRV
ncbi:MAG: dihydrofolate reductase, partial [Clostridia bacterium]|nr:dihydrofolate reductase [Clostridia bacterium]